MRTEAPDSASLADHAAGRVAAYVHIPFCRRICPYCDFAVQVGGDFDGYVSAVVREIESAEPFAAPLAAVYLGGGTPTSIGAGPVERILEALRDHFGLSTDAEVSIEANPEDCDPELLGALAGAGVNRMSLGVQSLDDDTLRYLGRAHSSAVAVAAVRAAVDTYPSVNADLIFGSPGESLDSWQRSVAGIVELGVAHLSTYALTVERGTPLSRSVADGAPAPDPDAQASAYEAACEVADGAGLVRYETSNFARPGHACTYNLVTWAQGEYAAFGNGAHRHRGGTRSWNVRRVDRYVEAVTASGSAVSGDETLGEWEREVERVMLGVRRAAGVVAGTAGSRLVGSAAGRLLQSSGVVAMVGDRLVVRRPLLGDEVARSLLALEE